MYMKKHYPSSISLIDTYSNRRRPTASDIFEDIESIELQEEYKNETAKESEDINFYRINEKLEFCFSKLQLLWKYYTVYF